jgi:hypothetical protein
MRSPTLVACALFASACAPSAPPAAAPSPLPPAPVAASPAGALPASTPPIDPSAVRAASISARIRFLSDDLLEGRFTGSRGHEIGARYVATELQAMGADPGGDAGTYLQPVPMRGAMKDPGKTSLVVRSHGKPDATLKIDEDFVLSSDLRTANVDVTAPLVFVGFGVTAPEYDYDDLAGVDLKGKIAVLFSGAPLSDKDDFFPPIAHAVHSDTREKIARLAARGAVGVLSVFRPEDEEHLPWARVAKQSHIEQMSWAKNGEPGTSAVGAPLRGTLYWKAFDAILARGGAGGSTAALQAAADKRALKAIDLQVSLHGKLSSKLRDFTSNNVVGILRGSDPKLANEYVAYSAHLDHLGIGLPIDGDAIYNGALDNASGTAAILEIARAYSVAPKRPARSILFLACTGEERGLLGSDYFARFPTVPAGSIVADFNDDMVLALGPLHDVVSLGAEHSTLGPIAADAAKSLGLETSPDPAPKQNIFIRSDQYSFVRQGIPSLYVGPGLKDEQGHVDVNAEKSKEWIATRYHAPKDEWDPSYDYEGMAQVARVELLTGFAVANAPERPSWVKGDFLGARFAGK